MSARGYVTIESTDNVELARAPYIQEYLYEEYDGVIVLEEVNWLDTERLVSEAPEVGWIAYSGIETEAANVAIVHLPNSKTVSYLNHADDEVVVAADQVNAIGWDEYLRINPGLRDYFTLQSLIEGK